MKNIQLIIFNLKNYSLIHSADHYFFLFLNEDFIGESISHHLKLYILMRNADFFFN